jgi:hypothetical protein
MIPKKPARGVRSEGGNRFSEKIMHAKPSPFPHKPAVDRLPIAA